MKNYYLKHVLIANKAVVSIDKAQIYSFNGLLNGKSFEYYDSGSIRIECEYQNGKRHGKWIEYNEDGTKYIEIEYQNDKRHGKMVEYYENNIIKAEYNYQNDHHHGKQIDYNENGTKYLEVECHNGVQHGIYILYDFGIKECECEYQKGRLIRVIQSSDRYKHRFRVW